MGEHCKTRTKFKGDGYKARQQLRAPSVVALVCTAGTFRRIPTSATRAQFRLGKRLARHLSTRSQARSAP